MRAVFLTGGCWAYLIPYQRRQWILGMNKEAIRSIGIVVIIIAAAKWLWLSIQQFASGARHYGIDGALDRGVLLTLCVAITYGIVAALLLSKNIVINITIILVNVPLMTLSIYLLFVAFADPVAIIFFAMMFVPSFTALYLSVVSLKGHRIREINKHP